MKLYIWKHKKRAIRPENIYPYAQAEQTGKNGIRATSCYAFFTKSDALKYMEQIDWRKEVKKNFDLLKIEVK